jgi:hypothetical protein
VVARIAVVFALACSVLAAGASAQTYLPLEVGTRWIYGSPDGLDRDTIVVVGPAVFDGLEVVEFRYQGLDAGLSNFWTVDSDGSVLLHGFDRPAESFAIHYIPPIRMVPAPVLQGQTWRDTVDGHCVRPGCYSGDTTTIFISTVTGIEPHTVPAGTFTAAAVELAIDLPTLQIAAARPGYTILGTRVASRNTMVEPCCAQLRWWADGVGLIHDQGAWTLLSYDHTTPVRATSWGHLKSIYR